MDVKQLQSVVRGKQSVQAAASKIMADPKEHDAFLADPAAYLKKAGVAVKGHIQLSDRDKMISSSSPTRN